MAIEFHHKDQCIVDGDKVAKLSFAQATVFHNLWSRKGEWVTIPELLTNEAGDIVPSEDPHNLIHHYLSSIRRALVRAQIKIPVENQHQSFWGETKYRIP